MMPLHIFIEELKDSISTETYNYLINIICTNGNKHYTDPIVFYTGKIEFNTTFNAQMPGGWIDWSKVKKRTTSFTKYIRYLSQFQHIKFHAKYVEEFQNALMNYTASKYNTQNYKFELVTGTAIKAAYKTGPDSCMRSRPSWLQMYVENPDKVSVLKIYTPDGKYKARALVWTTDSGQKVLDRVYPGNGTLGAIARKYAAEQGWYFPTHDGVGYKLNTDEHFTITLKHSSNNKLPYLDTFYKLHHVDDNKFVVSTKEAIEIDGKPHWCYNIGREYSTASHLYTSMRFIDGGYVPKTMVTGKTWKGELRLTLGTSNEVYTTVFINDRGVEREVAVRENGVAYHYADEEVCQKGDQIVDMDGQLYARQQLIKRRATGLFEVRRNQQPLKVVKVTEKGRGVKIITLERPK